MLITVRWTAHWYPNTYLNGNDLSFNLRVIQEYFEPKIGRTIRIFIMGQKNDFLPKKKSAVNHLRGWQDSIWEVNLNTCINKTEIIKIETILDVRTHGKNTKAKEIFQIKHFFTISLKVKNNLLRLRCYDYTLSFLPEYIL